MTRRARVHFACTNDTFSFSSLLRTKHREAQAQAALFSKLELFTKLHLQRVCGLVILKPLPPTYPATFSPQVTPPSLGWNRHMFHLDTLFLGSRWFLCSLIVLLSTLWAEKYRAREVYRSKSVRFLFYLILSLQHCQVETIVLLLNLDQLSELIQLLHPPPSLGSKLLLRLVVWYARGESL